MPQRHPRNCASAMFTKRMGGRVTLFNYNPSIAGGKIGVKRFHKTHRMGPVLRRNKQEAKTMIQGAIGSGAVEPRPPHWWADGRASDEQPARGQRGEEEGVCRDQRALERWKEAEAVAHSSSDRCALTRSHI